MVMTFQLSVTQRLKVQHVNMHRFNRVRYNRKESETWCYENGTHTEYIIRIAGKREVNECILNRPFILTVFYNFVFLFFIILRRYVER